MLFLFCVITLLTHLVAATVEIHIQNNGSVGSYIPVNWTREENDPNLWDFRLINDTMDSNGDIGVAVSVFAGHSLGGEASVPFPDIGQFTVVAVIIGDHDKAPHIIATSEAISIDNLPPQTSSSPPGSSVTSSTSTSGLPAESAATTSASPVGPDPTSPPPKTPPPASSKPTPRTPAIVGGVIGGSFFLLLIGFLMFWFIRRRRHNQASRRFTFNREFMVQRRDAPHVSLKPTDRDLEAAMIAQRPSAEPFSRPASSASRGSTQTTRQLDIELLITKLQAQILELHSQPARARDVEKMRHRVEWLQEQENSPWALGLTDERPPNYNLYMTPP